MSNFVPGPAVTGPLPDTFHGLQHQTSNCMTMLAKFDIAQAETGVLLGMWKASVQ